MRALKSAAVRSGLNSVSSAASSASVSLGSRNVRWISAWASRVRPVAASARASSIWPRLE